MFEKILEFLKARFGDVFVVVFAALGLVVTLVWLVTTFILGQAADSRNLYYADRLARCEETAKTVAQLATSSDEETLKKASARFEELYYGELPLFEDNSLARAMVNFRTRLRSPPPLAGNVGNPDARSQRNPQLDLEGLAIHVANACYNLVQPTLADQILSWFRQRREF